MKCDICGHDSVLIHKGTRDDPGIDVYRCTDCHTKQLNLVRENDYENGFMNGKAIMDENEIRNRLMQCRDDDIRRFRATKKWCENKDVLDFGCGFGGFLEQAEEVAHSVSGVELGSTERDYLLNQGYKVKKDISEFDKHFDVITLFHVFEHLKGPGKWIDIIADHLKEDGIVFIEVPNADDALLELYECDAFADHTYWSAHLYLYTMQSLNLIIERSGRFLIESAKQVQRYPLSNHLYWLAKGKPGGHQKWDLLNEPALLKEYERVLAENQLCDTLFFRLKKKA